MSAARHALLIDFGSTYTKLRAVDLDSCRIVGTGQGPSTVTTDVRIGLDAALADLGAKLGGLPAFRHRLASSSAAGGLRMVTVGLVKELTAEAARRAALGAGAKLVGAFAYRLTRADLAAIEGLAPDILLLAGGTDGGNSEVILHNAGALAATRLACPFIVAGNRAAADEVADLLRRGGKPVTVTGNVMPEFNVLDIEPARAAIRQVFIDRIVHAKGIDRAGEMFDAVLMPTPAAVLEAARLLAEGGRPMAGLGSVIVVDVGGATTDVHSVATGAPSRPEIILHGLPEPLAKRTVEGDLGMRHNAASIVEATGSHAIAAAAAIPEERVTALLAAVAADVERLPASPEEARFDAALAAAATRIAMRRHAGTIETVYTALGPATVQRGKDLGPVAALIGTGGPLVHAADPLPILSAALADPAEPASLRPLRPRLYLDRDYLLYAVGVLAEREPEAALRLASSSLQLLDRETRDGSSTAA
jgi:uncharacterized protein (TIGR01319 family)